MTIRVMWGHESMNMRSLYKIEKVTEMDSSLELPERTWPY